MGAGGLEPPVSGRTDLQSARLPITGYAPNLFLYVCHTYLMIIKYYDLSEEFIVKIDSEFKNASNKWLVEANTAEKNQTYTKLSQFSATMKNEKDENRYFRVFKIGADVSDYKYMYMWAYATNSITMETYINDTKISKPVALQAGWNMVELNISSHSTIDNFRFDTVNDYKIPTGYGYPNEGNLYSSQTGAVYFDSAWVSKAAMTAPVATPSIPDGQENVTP